MRRHPRRGEAGRQVTAPSARGAEVGRRIGVGLMYGLWKPRVLGAWKLPATGPAILAVNHSHNIDGPMVMGVSPRPTHFLIKKEAFIGPLDPFLLGIGQLKVDRHTTDRTAITDALGVLTSGGVLGIFPEGTRGDGDFASLRAGLAYFAVRSGAPIVPVAVLGSSGRNSRLIRGLPPLRSRVDVVFGDPFEAGDGSGRRTRSALDEATGRIQKQLSAHLDHARRLTGRPENAGRPAGR
ncbi:lysophospholipid acyltransferase family protein [Streptomyces sp. NPDC060011]|uniref:lysophospholipid acyltransferase family protein n=1 Tax=unclassified Streptomyces TaxID=2593676 RepID=UPI0013BA2AA9|nr:MULTISPECIES: lysophospholipid acyltransferase family protein [unclassified Streptomyces]MCX5138207.1 1-acyl-sn-glycerol-3-phosphate acyltransferase [Streptomyces sp. NBC_00340]NEB31681.1 1-acyl-sn-glycerol-3-phosphate acyltransferase [Streptomyces sp. SID14446]WSD80562.1 1-acyl-sn-glycerol-3-phosphate acyltransferase [Streptomyces sp. NBC_01558]WSK64132.1 1-acyl-sn-glycerol-3-phosphate acyltransferase [Streptomyces sp. NBC_01281]